MYNVYGEIRELTDLIAAMLVSEGLSICFYKSRLILSIQELINVLVEIPLREYSKTILKNCISILSNFLADSSHDDMFIERILKSSNIYSIVITDLLQNSQLKGYLARDISYLFLNLA